MPHKDPEQRRAYQRLYRERRADDLRAFKREWFRRRWADDPAFRDAYRTTVSPEAHAAQQRVHKALKRGEITRPTACVHCGRVGFVEAAHENYSERLAIRWLCRTCHRRWDAEQPKDAATGDRVFHQPVRLLVEYACARCGVLFRATPHNRRKSDTPCCSRRCAQLLIRERQRAEAMAAGIGRRECAWCGVVFYRPGSRQRAPMAFCSSSCAAKYRWHRVVPAVPAG